MTHLLFCLFSVCLFFFFLFFFTKDWLYISCLCQQEDRHADSQCQDFRLEAYCKILQRNPVQYVERREKERERRERVCCLQHQLVPPYVIRSMYNNTVTKINTHIKKKPKLVLVLCTLGAAIVIPSPIGPAVDFGKCVPPSFFLWESKTYTTYNTNDLSRTQTPLTCNWRHEIKQNRSQTIVSSLHMVLVSTHTTRIYTYMYTHTHTLKTKSNN